MYNIKNLFDRNSETYIHTYKENISESNPFGVEVQPIAVLLPPLICSILDISILLKAKYLIVGAWVSVISAL